MEVKLYDLYMLYIFIQHLPSNFDIMALRLEILVVYSYAASNLILFYFFYFL